MYLKLVSFKLILVGNWEDSDLDMIIVQSSLRMHRVPVQDPISKDAEVPFSQPFASTDSTYAHRRPTVYLLKRKTTYKGTCAFQTCVVQGSGNHTINYHPHIVGLPYPQVLHLHTQPTAEQKYSRKKNSRKLQKVQFEFAWQIHHVRSYNNLEMIYSIHKVVHRLYANTLPFYIKDLSICRF